jgi:hypothetical protein
MKNMKKLKTTKRIFFPKKRVPTNSLFRKRMDFLCPRTEKIEEFYEAWITS